MRRFWKTIKRRPLRFATVSSLFLLAFAFEAKTLIGVGAILIGGIGDGYPSAGMKALGAGVLFVTATIAIVILGTFVVSLYCLAADRDAGAKRKAMFFVGLAIAFGTAILSAWIKGGEEAAIDAIIRGDLAAYHAAARRRTNGNINDDLWLAARWGRKQLVESLLKQGANPNSRSGSTVLEAARENLGHRPNDNEEVIAVLSSHGATNFSPNVPSKLR